MEIIREKPQLRLVKTSFRPGMTAPPRPSYPLHPLQPLRPPSRGAYYRRMESYAHRIRAASNVADIVDLLDQAVVETRALDRPVDGSREEQEIRALKAELEQLRTRIYVDHLTGLLNRGVLNDSYAREAARADRGGKPLAVALLDIDDFKAINDRHGHPAGDGALAHIARIIRETMRPSDVVVRYGGEEFLFLLPDANAEQATQALTRVQSGLDREPLACAGEPLCLGFSAGVAVRHHGESRDAAIARADAALYAAKRAGKRKVCASTP
jgi:diguanylate cyclase